MNAQHIKAVPGRKTDVKDAEWIAELLRHGLLTGSFVPPEGQRELRELTRYRSTFVKERATLVNRVQKALESANIKLASVATDITGVSGRAILQALLEGQVKPHHRFVLTELLCQIDSLDETIARFDEQIQEYCHPFEEAVKLLDTIPGVARETAEVIVAEIGTDMSRFPSADHLASWAGVAPGNNESAGKCRSGKTTQGNHALGVALNHAANAASHTKNTYLAAQYHRLASRRGKKKAIVALEHSILIIAYHLIQRNEPYRELGGDYFDKRRPEATVNKLVKRLEHMGFHVVLQSDSVPLAA